MARTTACACQWIAAAASTLRALSFSTPRKTDGPSRSGHGAPARNNSKRFNMRAVLLCAGALTLAVSSLHLAAQAPPAPPAGVDAKFRQIPDARNIGEY